MKTPDPLYWQKLREKSARANPLKRSPIKTKAVKIRKCSKKREKELREYEKVKAEFFETHTKCEWPGCEVEHVTLHHQRGRIGDNLTNADFFKALCWVHHQWVEENPVESKAMGLSLDRLT